VAFVGVFLETVGKDSTSPVLSVWLLNQPNHHFSEKHSQKTGVVGYGLFLIQGRPH